MVVKMLDLLSVWESYSNTTAAEILWEVVSLAPKWRWVVFPVRLTVRYIFTLFQLGVRGQGSQPVDVTHS